MENTSKKTSSNERRKSPKHPFSGAMFGECTLPETNIALENQWLEDEFSFWDGLFSGAMLV